MRARWVASAPLVVAVAGCVALLARFGTPVLVSALFIAYLLLLVALPGTVAWRLLGGGRGPFVEQVVVGSALALATQAILGFVLAPIHAGGLSWVWAPAVVGVSLHPRLRRRAWTAPQLRGESVVGSWVQAGAVLAATAWVGVTSLAPSPLAIVDGVGPWVRAVPTAAYFDMPFHQSLAAGINRFFPLVYPYLDGEPLHYHLLAYEQIAGVTAVTGIDPTWVLYRLDVVALVALAVVAVGVLARQASRMPGAAPVAAVLAALSSAVAPYGWTATPFTSAGLLQSATFRSPTHTFGLPLLLAALTVAAMTLPRPHSGPGDAVSGERRMQAIAFGILAVGAGGAKSTLLPVLIAGLALVVVVSLVARSPARWPAILLVVSVAAFGVLVVVLLHGQSGSLEVAPLGVVYLFTAWGVVGQGVGAVSRAGLVALGTIAWLCAGAGGMLLARREQRTDPLAWLLVGTAVAGPAGAVLTTASGASEVYFLYASWPVLVVVSVWGWAAMWRAAVDRGLRRLAIRVSVAAAVLGPLLVLLARAVSGRAAPPHLPANLPVRALVVPWFVLLAGALLGGLVAFVGARRGRHGAVVGLTVVALALVSATVVTRPAELVDNARVLAGGSVAPESVSIPLDGARAALFVRDHAGIHDVIATNGHCLSTATDTCDARHFWISALTERRVLLEGWAYPEGFHPGITRTSPFWDQSLYAANQAVFTDPTAENVAALHDEHGVTWLFVDRTAGRESDRLRQYAQLVLDDGSAAVYRIG